MAKAIGISVGSVQRIWRAHKLQPHRLRTFKRSRDPSFAAKLTDIVGLYAADRNRPRKHVERARIVLASADRHSAQRVGPSIGVSRRPVWRWKQRFAESGVEGLLRDKTRKPGKAPLAAETTAQVVALTCTAPPHQATHWTGRAMAKATGISVGSVQRIWRAHKLQPHRLRTFKRSRDPSFAAKLTAVVGLYIDPRTNGVPIRSWQHWWI